MSQNLIVKKEEEGLTLKEYLLNFNNNLTFPVLQKWIRKGEIKVNNKKVSLKQLLVTNDLIKIPPSHFFPNNSDKQNSYLTLEQALENLKEIQIFENSEYIVLNKKAGLAVQGGTGVKESIDDWLKVINQNKNSLEKFRLVHRIDQETTGLLLIAKTFESAKLLTKSFKENLIQKKYLAITKNLPNIKDCIKYNLIKDTNKKDFEKMRVVMSGENGLGNRIEKGLEKGLEAITYWKLLKKEKDFYLIELKPTTGRKHQIRVHLNYTGATIVGDKKYFKDAIEKKYNQNFPLMLHAYEIYIPIYKNKHTAPLPDEFLVSL